jgi:DnaJ like chaperone protein
MRELRLGEAEVRLAIAEFTHGKQPHFDPDTEMADLRAACHFQPEILLVFVEIQLRFALAGSDMAASARARITRAAGILGIEPALLARMEAASRGGAGPATAGDRAARAAAAYRTLEADPAVTNEELTRIYRRLMSRHHPDKLKANGLPDSMLEHAKQRTQAIQEAYELLRGQRGMG